MSETTSSRAAKVKKHFKSGRTFHLDDLSSLNLFEDAVVQATDALTTRGHRSYWNGRTPIESRLRPDTFHGVFTDIILRVLEDPYQKLSRYTEHETRLYSSPNFTIPCRPEFPAAEDINQHLDDLTIGFEIEADARSSRHTLPIAGLYARLFYVPLARTRNTDPGSKTFNKPTTISHHGEGLRRYVELPTFADAAYLLNHDAAVNVGAAVMRQNLRDHFGNGSLGRVGD